MRQVDASSHRSGTAKADQGVVQYAGTTYLRPRLHRLARQGLFYFPPDGFLTPGLTLRQHLEAVQNCFGTNPMWAVERLGVAELLDVKTRAFSGGERRRAEVALALGREPRCLLADEPFAGISPATAEVLAKAFRDSRTRGCALVITGHEVPQLMEVADEVVWATAGTTHHIGSPAEAAQHEQFRREYLGPGQWDGSPRKSEASRVLASRPVP